MSFYNDENCPTTAIIDPAGAFAYFGTYTDPGKVVNVALPGLTRLGATIFNSGGKGILSAVIDPNGDYAYFGTDTNHGKLIKVRLSNMQRVDSLTLEP